MAIDELNQFIGLRIREFRTVRSLSMNDLAQQIGISHQQFHKYENGSNRVSAAVLFKIAQILGANLEDFFPKAIEGERLPNVVGLMDSLDPVTRLQVMALVEKLAAKA